MLFLFTIMPPTLSFVARGIDCPVLQIGYNHPFRDSTDTSEKIRHSFVYFEIVQNELIFLTASIDDDEEVTERKKHFFLCSVFSLASAIPTQISSYLLRRHPLGTEKEKKKKTTSAYKIICSSSRPIRESQPVGDRKSAYRYEQR